MRSLQILFGLLFVTFGLLFLASSNGLLALTPPDVAGVCLFFSGLLFWVPGLSWRKVVPGLTALFIPGSLAFAAGLILIAIGRVGWSALLYGWPTLLIALGVGLFAMYYWGPRVQPLGWAGVIVGGIGLFLLGLTLSLFGSDPITRTVGPILLVAVGLALALHAALGARRATPSTPDRTSQPG